VGAVSTADTTLAAEVAAIMTDVAVDVPGVATAFGRREASAHHSPPMVGWWPTAETPGGARKSAFPGARRELYSTTMTLTVRCWAIAATPDHTYATDDVEALMRLRESVIACLHRRLPGAYTWERATYVTDPDVTSLGEAVDLAITLRVGVLDRAPMLAPITSTALTVPSGAANNGDLDLGEP
jgi:hypothetical protein